MRMNVERNLSALRWHFRERRHADGNVVAHSMCFHNRLIRTFRQQSSAEMSNHRGYCTAADPERGCGETDNGGNTDSPSNIIAQIKHAFSCPIHRKFLRSTVFTQPSPTLTLR